MFDTCQPLSSWLNLSGRPTEGPDGTSLNSVLSGRKERRLPLIVAVDLARVDGANVLLGDDRERTYTDNISPHGLRVLTRYPWKVGDQVEIAPVNGEPAIWGEVVYCQSLSNGGFFIGLKSPARVSWSIMQRFDGI